MMKNSSLLKWTNSKNNKNKNANKNWIHPPEALQGGHIAYLVKFLGNTEVSQSKGIEVVKEAITKLRFNQQIKKTEGSKTPKVELTISADGVAVQHPKSKKISFQYPLHQISYCADDKAEKRFFSFIAKEADRDAHTCFVFISDKLAEEITLTIGQAFDLAYKKFLENSNKEGDVRKQMVALKQQLLDVQKENNSLKERLTYMSSIKDNNELKRYIEENRDVFMNGKESNSNLLNYSMDDSLSDQDNSPTIGLPPVPPRTIIKADVLADADRSDDDFDFDPRAEERHSVSPPPAFSLSSDVIGNGTERNGNGSPESNDPFSDDDFDPRADEMDQNIFGSAEKSFDFQIKDQRSSQSLHLNGVSNFPTLVPPPRPTRQQDKLIPNHILNDSQQDPFSSPPGNDILSQFDEMKVGFNRGLSFGTADSDFTLESLDPLKN